MPDRAEVTRGTRPVLEAGAITGLMCLFGLLARAPWPWFIAGAAGLLGAMEVIRRDLVRGEPFGRLFALNARTCGFAAFLLVGVALGAGCGVGYRAAFGVALLPATLTPFAATAALIGAAEELLYRGYLQGRLRGFGPFGAAAGAAACHTVYKVLLFVPLFAAADTDLVFLACVTFAGGFIFGLLRERARSVLPPLAAHACFDIVVYGGLAHAPGWVWS